MRKIPLSCNLRFNVKNERHMKAAEILAMVGARYKTAFVALAIEAYLETHSTGIDMNELSEIQKETWRPGSSKKYIDGKLSNIPPPLVESASSVVSIQESDESSDAAKNALSYYNI